MNIVESIEKVQIGLEIHSQTHPLSLDATGRRIATDALLLSPYNYKPLPIEGHEWRGSVCYLMIGGRFVEAGRCVVSHIPPRKVERRKVA